MNKKYYKKALTIAGSDSGGGAGIQADIKTFSANGIYGMSAITAITAQNTKGVTDIHPVPVEIIKSQITAVMDDIGTDAIKIGMLHSSKVIQKVVESLKKYNPDNIVVDPVMVATSGDKLLQDEAIETLIKEMLPLATVITPNLPEAEIILGQKIETEAQFLKAARELSKTKAKAILLKAGHFKNDELVDILYLPDTDEIVKIPGKWTNTKNKHGTGCTLSSAIAAQLAHGFDLKTSIQKGVKYTHQSIQAGADFQLGHGHGPVHHFHKFWN